MPETLADVTLANVTLADVALDQALARIGELSGRLWAVRSAHRPRAGVLRRARCAECGRSYPCPTSQVAGALRPVTSG